MKKQKTEEALEVQEPIKMRSVPEIDNVRFILPIYVFGPYPNNIKRGYMNVKIEIVSNGVMFTFPKTEERLETRSFVPYANIRQIEFVPTDS